ncbi:MAG TPA: hypothetical protein PKD86_03300 [Gemmatales bacterium]|nr:hypothetical protein [Gemmatales bacterium]HMP58360.1 hypothetical protein [Gemmatales bacterium]
MEITFSQWLTSEWTLYALASVIGVVAIYYVFVRGKLDKPAQ